MTWSFDGVVRRVLAFSRAAEFEDETSKSGVRVASSRSLAAADQLPTPALEALRLFVRSLDGETRSKLRAVMRAGRNAEPLQVALAAISAEDANADGELDPFARGAAALQDLQRGHAVACATGFDLELELAAWSAVGKHESLDERVWLRFGRELARSDIGEWSCFALVDARDQLETLYLGRGQNSWWSFSAVIDRPSERALGLARTTRSRRSRVVTLSLQAALGRSCLRSQRAVRRASMALSARLGMCRVPEERKMPIPARQPARKA